MAIKDLLPSTEEVAIDGGTLTVRGLSNRTVFELLAQFPALALYLSGEGVEIAKAIAVTPDACLAVLRHGVIGAESDEDARILDGLPLESQFNLLASIARMTCPGGIGPLVERLKAFWIPTSLPATVDEESGRPISQPPQPQARSNSSPAPSPN